MFFAKTILAAALTSGLATAVTAAESMTMTKAEAQNYLNERNISITVGALSTAILTARAF